MKLLTPLLTLSLLSAGSLAAQHRELIVDTDQLKAFTVEAGAGELHIKGEEGRTEILVNASIETDFGSSLDEDDYELTLERDGDTARLVGRINEDYRGEARIHLEVLMPKRLRLDVNDGSGELRVEDISADVNITDGSGSTDVRTVAGNLRVKDGSGDLRIVTVAGDVHIDDGSGDLTLLTVAGSAHIIDGSGDLEVNTVSGNLTIDDGSGSIEVSTVTGLVEVTDGSGDIRVDDVGDFDLRSDGSGGVELTNLRK